MVISDYKGYREKIQERFENQKTSGVLITPEVNIICINTDTAKGIKLSVTTALLTDQQLVSPCERSPARPQQYFRVWLNMYHHSLPLT